MTAKRKWFEPLKDKKGRKLRYRISCDGGPDYGYACDAAIDGIHSLAAARAKGWKVHAGNRVRTYRQSVTPSPPAASVFDWETHIGACPECAGDLP